MCGSVTYIPWSSDFFLNLQDYFWMNVVLEMLIHYLSNFAYSCLFNFYMKMFVNLARLERGKLNNTGAMRGHPCTLDTFIIRLDKEGI